MTIRELLNRIEAAETKLRDTGVYDCGGIDRVREDLFELIHDIEDDGVSNQYRSIH
jgi:hypothetical protein